MHPNANYHPQYGLPVRLRQAEAARAGAIAAANGQTLQECKYRNTVLRSWWQIGYDEELTRLKEGGLLLRDYQKVMLPFRKFKARVQIYIQVTKPTA